MNTELSWFDRNIIPLTKAYRDFIKAKESTPPERWNWDGERKFTNQQKKFLEIYKNREGKKQFTAAAPRFSEPVIPEQEKKAETIKNPKMISQLGTSEEQYIVGKITKYDLFGEVSEVKDYWSAEDYLKALENQADRINFQNETFLRDPELLKKVDDFVLGRENAYSLEHYIEMVKSEIPVDPVLHTPSDIFKLNNKILDQKQKGLEGIVGQLFFFEPRGAIVEVMKYTSSEAYINAIKTEFESNINNFKFDTVLRDPELVKKVEDLVYDVYGEDNPNSLEFYIDLVAKENILERYVKVPGSFSSAKNEIIDLISDDNLLEIKSLKEKDISNEMRADNFSTIGLLRDDIDKIDEVLFERNNNVSILPDNDLDSIADKIQKYFHIEEEASIPLHTPSGKEFLKQAIEVANMPDELQKEVLQFIVLIPPTAPEPHEYRDDSIDQGQGYYEKAYDNYKTVVEPKYIEKMYVLTQTLKQNNISIDKLPVFDEFKANYFATFVGELKRNFKNEISRFHLDEFIDQDMAAATYSKDTEQLQYHKNQLKYLGFGEGEKLHKDLQYGIDSNARTFEINTQSNNTQLGNIVDFTIQYARLDQGEIFLNSYDGHLTNEKGENITQNFKVTKDNHFTAKEAINLLEGRSVKIEYTNPLTDLREQAFVKLNLSEEKNHSGNYNFQTFRESYGINTRQIVENSNIIFDRPELKEKAISSLEKGDIVNVQINVDDRITKIHAVLNPQYKTLNLYDSGMNRINSNKPIQGLDDGQQQDKSNVRQQSISRGI